jgi:hypothetical protein
MRLIYISGLAALLFCSAPAYALQEWTMSIQCERQGECHDSNMLAGSLLPMNEAAADIISGLNARRYACQVKAFYHDGFYAPFWAIYQIQNCQSI